MDNVLFSANSDFETLRVALHGRRVLVEVREGPRWHHRGIAECRVSRPSATASPVVELVIPQPYRAAELAQGPHVLQVPPERFAHFQPASGVADYQFVGVLYDNDDVDESTRIADKPFVIVSPDQRDTSFDPKPQDAVENYLRQLRAGDFESAFHGLLDLDPAIVQPLITAYHAETSPTVRSNLLRIIWEFRTPLALPLLGEVLRDRRDDQWKGALDGLVTLASAEAVQTLERVLSEECSAPDPDSTYIEWVREALEQTQEAHAAKKRG